MLRARAAIMEREGGQSVRVTQGKDPDPVGGEAHSTVPMLLVIVGSLRLATVEFQ